MQVLFRFVCAPPLGEHTWQWTCEAARAALHLILLKSGQSSSTVAEPRCISTSMGDRWNPPPPHAWCYLQTPISILWICVSNLTQDLHYPGYGSFAVNSEMKNTEFLLNSTPSLDHMWVWGSLHFHFHLTIRLLISSNKPPGILEDVCWIFEMI